MEAYGGIEGRLGLLHNRVRVSYILSDTFGNDIALYPDSNMQRVLTRANGKIVVVEGIVCRDQADRVLSIHAITQVTERLEGAPEDYKRARGVISSKPDAQPEVIIRQLRD